MSDAELRARAREAEESPDDPAAARAWVAVAERSGAGLSRALAHLARLGDVASHERLARTVPWPHQGDARACRLRSRDHARAALGTRLVALEPPVTIRAARGLTEALAPDGTVLWSSSTVGPIGALWLATTGLVDFEEGRLTLRDLRTGAVRTSAEMARPMDSLAFARAAHRERAPGQRPSPGASRS